MTSEPAKETSEIRRPFPVRLGAKGVVFLLIAGFFLALGVGVTLLKTSLKRSVAAEIKRIKESGEPLILEDLAREHRLAVTNLNAADFLQQAFTTLSTNVAEVLGKIVSEYKEAGFRLDGAEMEKLEQMVGQHEKTFELLEQAFEMDRAAFPLSWQSGYAMMLRHLGPLRTVARLLQARAILNIERQQPGRAVRDLAGIWKLSRYLEREPILVSQLVRFSIGSIGFEGIRAVFQRGGLNAGELWELQQELVACQGTEPMVRAYMAERVFGIEYLMAPERLPGVLSVAPPALTIYRGTGLLYYDQKLYLKLMAATIEAAQTTFPEALEKVVRVQELMPPLVNEEEGPSLPLPKPGTLALMLLPGLTNGMSKQATFIAQTRMGYLAAELEKERIKTGRFPAALADLPTRVNANQYIDPFTGLSFLYEMESGGFVLYSVGPDRQDDGGVESAAKGSPRGILASNPVPHGKDVVFRVKRE